MIALELLPDLGDPLRALRWFSTFGLVLAVWMIFVLVWDQRRTDRRRRVLRRLEEDGVGAPGGGRQLRLWHEGGEATLVVPGERRATFGERIEQIGLDAGWRTPARTVFSVAVGASLVLGALALFATGRLAPAAVAVAGTLFAFWFVTSRRIVERTAVFERQLIDALELCARALRSGHPLTGAFQLLASEIPAPVGTIFTEVCQQQAMGASLDDSLRRAADLTRSSDMKLFSAALAIHLRSGGNLAGVMDSLAQVIRERMRLNRRFRVITAQTRFSQRILIALPFLLFGVLTAISPEYARPLYTTTPGVYMSVAAVFLLLVGWFMMERLSLLRE